MDRKPSGPRRVATTLLGFLFAACLLSPAAARTDDEADVFIAGYVTALLERDFHLSRVAVHVADGVVTLGTDDIQDRDREKIRSVLAGIPGVRKVLFVAGRDGPPPRQPRFWRRITDRWWLFPEERLFKPLLADPRWPHFSVGYFRMNGSRGLREVGSVSMGEQFNLAGFVHETAGKFALGLQPAVFGIFQMDTVSDDLVNADYLVAIPLDYRYRSFSAQARLFHQSSHLGDEFLLNNDVRRVNVSHEGADLRASLDFNTVRVYGGGGRILRTDPNRDPWFAQQGAEYLSPRSYINNAVRPVLAADVQEREEFDWEIDFSGRAGVEFTSAAKGDRRVQVLLEYYKGRNLNGQFFEERIETYGIGLHMYF